MIFKRVGDVRPYPDHGYVQKQWAAIAPHQVRLDQLVTTKDTLQLGGSWSAYWYNGYIYSNDIQKGFDVMK